MLSRRVFNKGQRLNRQLMSSVGAVMFSDRKYGGREKAQNKMSPVQYVESVYCMSFVRWLAYWVKIITLKLKNYICKFSEILKMMNLLYRNLCFLIKRYNFNK